MIPSEILKHVKKIQIRTRHMVTDVLAGQYHSVFKGRGMEFDEVRLYQAGDDVRSIDWNVTARTGHPHIKKYVEERELTVMLMFDASGSGAFGSYKRAKREYAAELGAVLAFSAIQNNDKVGLIIFSDTIEKYIPPKKGRRHVLRVIREILFYEPQNKGTDIGRALEFFGNVVRRRTVCFLISDFLASGFSKDLEAANKRHDMIAVSIADPREQQLPSIGIIELEDMETGKTSVVDTKDVNVVKAYSDSMKKTAEERRKMFRSINVDHIEIHTDKPYLDPLLKFFSTRGKRR